ncbi:MAG: hypothetical protein QOJ03_231 [Frankiaceae bacterium]|nr:hypothetical protein [Frankiaceae bacterium]
MGRTDTPLRDRMVFLVGAQRSGTNWLQRMLATHPDIATLPSETQLFTVGIDVLAERVQHGVLSSTSTATVFMEREAFLDATRAFCDAAFGGVAERLRPGARRILERSPNHVERLALIGDIYPDAWVIHIVRDGRDVARSLVSQRWGPATVGAAAELWDRSVRSAREAAPALRRYREVRYEDLLADPAAGVTKLFAFLELDASEQTVAATLQEAGVAANTEASEIGDGKWRSEWGPREIAEFDKVAGDLLVELGYPPADGASHRPRVPDVRELAGKLRRTAAPKTADAPTRPHLPMEVRQRRVDALCAALSSGDADRASADLAPAALVRVVAAGSDRQARAEPGRELLAKALAADPTPWGTQRRGDVHVSGSMFTVVLTHDGAEGCTDRVVVVHFDGKAQITALTLYGFPL